MQTLSQLCVAFGLVLIFAVLGMDTSQVEAMVTAVIVLAVGCAFTAVGNAVSNATDSSVGKTEMEVQ